MNDKQFETLKAKVTKLSKKWRAMMGLTWWKINYHFERSKGETRVKVGSVTATCGASTLATWQYREATITWYLETMDLLDAYDLEDMVIHEHAHILVNEMREEEDWLKHEERVVTDLTSAFRWTYKREK